MTAPGSGATPPPPRRRRWLVPLLVASVAVNLVIIGVALAGQLWSEPGARGDYHRSAHLLPRQFFTELDHDRRSELTSVFRDKRTEFRDERGALRDAAAALADALEQEPFDAAQAQSAIAEHAARSQRLVEIGAIVASDLVETLTPEERRALAQSIRQRLEESRQRREHRKR